MFRKLGWKPMVSAQDLLGDSSDFGAAVVLVKDQHKIIAANFTISTIRFAVVVL